MTHDLRRTRLEKITACAAMLREPLRLIHAAHGYDVHLRPTSSNGVTMIGLSAGRPQRGKGGFNDMERLVRDFRALFDEHCMPDSHGRDTPEKELQSALIRDAYAHSREMTLLTAAFATTNAPLAPIFVTDEIALPTDDGGKMVCDMLCVTRNDDGSFRPLLIELKSERAKKTLIAQVEGYAAFVDEQSAGFEALTTALLGSARLVGACQKCIVWPGSGEGADRHAKDLAARGIRLVAYTQSEDGAFTLRAHDVTGTT